jgi:hypothetical protein
LGAGLRFTARVPGETARPRGLRELGETARPRGSEGAGARRRGCGGPRELGHDGASAGCEGAGGDGSYRDGETSVSRRGRWRLTAMEKSWGGAGPTNPAEAAMEKSEEP